MSAVHAPVASLLDLLGSALPEVLTALDAVDARLLSASESGGTGGGTGGGTATIILPEAVLMAAVSEPSLVIDDPELLAAAAARGALLIDELAGPVKKLGPRVDEMLGLGATLQVWTSRGGTLLGLVLMEAGCLPRYLTSTLLPPPQRPPGTCVLSLTHSACWPTLML